MFKGLRRRLEWRRWVIAIWLFLCFSGFMAFPSSSTAQELNRWGWPIPDVKGVIPYSMSIQRVDGVEKVTEKFYTVDGGHVARITGNGKVFAYAVDRDQDPPIDYLILDADGSGKFTLKFGPGNAYFIPEWVSR